MILEQLQKLFYFKTKVQETNEAFEVEIAPPHFKDLLEKINLYPKVFFENRSGYVKLGFGYEKSLLPDFFSFYLSEYNWAPKIPQKTFGLPESVCSSIQISQNESRCILKWSKSLKEIKISQASPSTFPLIQKSETTPAYHDWLYMFQKVQFGELKKYVPARKQTLTLSEPLNPILFFEKVRKPAHYNFLIQRSENECFLGSSPERLLKIENSTLETEAVAGTRIIDRAQELLSSEKDLKEHEWVVKDIEERLSTFSSHISKDDSPSLYHSKNLAHLKTFIKAQVSEVRINPIVKALSPTAAICGYPHQLALETLQTYEKFQRGFYSAPIGFYDSNSAEITVAIRSCYIYSQHSPLSPTGSNILELYSGVGVVFDSDAANEWTELDLKIKPYMDLLK